MPTLRDYLAAASGTFTSPNHPVPVTGHEVMQVLGDSEVTIPGATPFDVNLLEVEFEAVQQDSGDRWLYPLERDIGADTGPFLIHHPDAS